MRKHKNRKFIRKSCFTLFELLISVGLLVVLSVVLLRTLVLTSDYWIKTDEQAQLQSDAKTFFSLLSDDLGNLIYAPRTSTGGFYAPLHLENDRLCMVTHTRVQTNTNTYSDVCKVAYKLSGRKLERWLISDNASDTSKYEMTNTSATVFYPTTEWAVNEVVIDNVIEFEPKAYYFDSNGEPQREANGDVFASKRIRMIHVKLVLLPEKRHAEYNGLSSEEEKRDYIRKHGRIFYKAFWINPSKQ